MAPHRFVRSLVSELTASLRSSAPLLHILIGPRQTGKTTAARQVAEAWPGGVHFAAADGAVPPGPEWVGIQWEVARAKRKGSGRVLLILDEIQKVKGWSEAVKAL